MSDSPYKTAGWMSVVQAVLFPLMIVVGVAQGVIARFMGHEAGLVVGPSDIMGLAFTLLSIYVLWNFRRLLNERYSCSELDTLITVVIVWNIVMQVLSLGTGILLMIFPPSDQHLFAIVGIIMLVLMMIPAGIINILIAVQLFRLKDRLTDTIHVYGWICMIAGACQITVILSFVAMILVPVACIVMALILFKEKDELEFV